MVTELLMQDLVEAGSVPKTTHTFSHCDPAHQHPHSISVLGFDHLVWWS